MGRRRISGGALFFLFQVAAQLVVHAHRFRLEAPADVLGPLLPALARLRATARTPAIGGSSCTIEGDIAAAHVHDLRQQLPALTRGEGVLECAFDRYEPVGSEIPRRPRSDDNPLHREEYLLRVARGGRIGRL